MIGAVAGDMIGSIYEHHPIKVKEFPLFDWRSRFTDDSVLTVATAEALLDGEDYPAVYMRYYFRYPDAGYGRGFHTWARSGDLKPYQSFGNGSAMRVSPVAYAFDTLDEVVAQALRSAEVTHNHPEGVKGAQATAAAVFLARRKTPKDAIRDAIASRFGYDLSRGVDQIRPEYKFDSSCQGTVPAALASFFDAEDYEDAVRNAISLGGDADTLACIAGAVAGAWYGVPDFIAREARERLDDPLRKVVERFERRFKL